MTDPEHEPPAWDDGEEDLAAGWAEHPAAPRENNDQRLEDDRPPHHDDRPAG